MADDNKWFSNFKRKYNWDMIESSLVREKAASLKVRITKKIWLI